MLEGRVGFVEVDLFALHLEDADVLGARPAIEIVLVDAGLDAGAVSLALGDVERVAEHHAGLRGRGLDPHVDVVLDLRQALEPRDRVGALLVGHEAVVLLDVLLPLQELRLAFLVRVRGHRTARADRLSTDGSPAQQNPQRAPAIHALLEDGAILVLGGRVPEIGFMAGGREGV